MPNTAANATEYLEGLPDDRRELVEALLTTIRENLDPRFEEGMQYRMPAFFLPHSEYEWGYHCDPKQPVPFASVANQKNAVSLYLFCTYLDEEEKARFVEEWKATGNRLDMGKSCVRIKKLEQVPLEVVGNAIRRMTADRFIERYDSSVPEKVKAKRKK